MSKLNFLKLAFFAFLLSFLPHEMYAQSVTCAARNATLDGSDCRDTYTPSSVGGNDTDHDLQLHDENGTLITGNIVTRDHLGQTLTYSLLATGTTNVVCWNTLLIEDKTAPSITCAANVIVRCDQTNEIDSIPMMGDIIEPATATDCSGIASLTYSDAAVNLSCSDNGQFSRIVTRTWVAVDNNGMSTSCQQTISVQRANIADVVSPSDYSALCTVSTSVEPSVTGYPTFNGANLIPGNFDDCMFIVDFEDQEFEKCGPDRLILRTWIVLNMCSASTMGAGEPNEIATFEQNIILTTPAPVIEAIDSYTVSADATNRAPEHGGCNSTAALTAATVNTNCTGQFVRRDDIRISIPGLGTIENGGNIPSPGLPIGGPYTITYIATDTCGLMSTLDVSITVVDNTGPICITEDKNITLSSANGTATADFITFDGGSYDNCSGNVWVSIRRLNGECTDNSIVDTFGEEVSFCCNDIPSGMTENDVMIQQLVCDQDPSLASNYVRDSIALDSEGAPVDSLFMGNCTRCMAVATVKLPTSSTPCSDQAGVGNLISGLISTADGAPVEAVEMQLDGATAASTLNSINTMTNFDGRFEISIDDPSQFTALTPVKNGDYDQDINTLDLLVLARHVLGLKEISNAYAYISADVTGNGIISTSDMVHLQRLILGITETLPDNSSWRFVVEDHVFDDMGSILDYSFPERLDLSSIDWTSDVEANFIAIKIGDLKGAYDQNLLGGNSTTEQLQLSTRDQQLAPGAIIDVPITAASAKALAGYQHAYAFDPSVLTFAGIEYGVALNMGDHNFGFNHLSEGYLTTSWYDVNSVDIDAEEILYTLQFEVHQAAQLSTVLEISSNHTNAEAYFNNDAIGTVDLKYIKPISSELVARNTPNPFSGTTLIEFDAPQIGDATIIINDISGKEVYSTQLEARKGTNQFAIHSSELGNAGIYFLKIQLAGEQATIKMVLQE